MADPLYSSEYVDAAADVLRRFLVPALAAAGPLDAHGVAPALAPFKGHRMAKAALEMAVLDAELRAAGPLVRRASSAPSTTGCPAASRSASWTASPRCSTRSAATSTRATSGSSSRSSPAGTSSRSARSGSGSATTCCSRSTRTRPTPSPTPATWPKLDPFDLLLIEQPLDEEDVLGHADLARQIRTPVCLDESITSAQSAAAAIRLGACAIVNIKPGRVGGYLEARRIHDVCAASGVPVWCGGMLETGLGRAANVALAALPGFTLPGDTSALGALLPHATSPSRSCSTTATWRSRPGRASASLPLAGRAGRR